jgi:flagellar basal-body rod protein FlgF
VNRSIQGVAYAMRVQAERFNITASNISNISTRAYKRESVSVKSFDEVLIEALSYGSSAHVGSVGYLSLGSAIDEVKIVYNQGNLENTGYATDFAVRGDGFFTVEAPGGVLYTRAGNFIFSEDGYLITREGYYVLGENGRLRPEMESIEVRENGEIYYLNTDDEQVYVDRFRLTGFNDLSVLRRDASGYYSNTVFGNAFDDGGSSVLQRHIEDSNVDVVAETRDMMEAKRNFESCQQIIKMLDDTMGKAANEIARL